MCKKALVVLAEGFEEIEAVTPIDILRRAGVSVTVAGVGKTRITGSRGLIPIECETTIEDADDLYDAIVLPGGMPGAKNLFESKIVQALTTTLAKSNKIVAAICATPAVLLAPLGILNNKKATCYPSMEEHFHASTSHSSDAVVVDRNIITSQGPATAFAFSLAIVEALYGIEKRNDVAHALLYT